MRGRYIYGKKGSMDKIRWGQNFSSGENREYIKVLTHPHLVPQSSGTYINNYKVLIHICIDIYLL